MFIFLWFSYPFGILITALSLRYSEQCVKSSCCRNDIAVFSIFPDLQAILTYILILIPICSIFGYTRWQKAKFLSGLVVLTISVGVLRIGMLLQSGNMLFLQHFLHVCLRMSTFLDLYLFFSSTTNSCCSIRFFLRDKSINSIDTKESTI